MQKLIQIISLLLMISIASATTKAQNLVEYNNEVLYHYTLLDNQIARLDKGIFDEKVTQKELNQEYALAKKMYKYNGKALKNITQHPKDKYFLPAVIKFYEEVNNTLENEYKQIIDMYNQEWKSEFGSKITQLANEAVQKISKEEENVIKQQEKFAEDNDLKLN
ncbi:MAG TPA: hypothetical protein P5250_01225 [Bacteroidales bacterium]|nr:hypothetical protein [Bacteroidales bacterium]